MQPVPHNQTGNIKSLMTTKHSAYKTVTVVLQ